MEHIGADNAAPLVGNFVPRSGSVATAVMRVLVVSAFCSAVIIEMTDFLDEFRPACLIYSAAR